jgi:putative hydrolase of the HAD superfamily
MIRGVTFDWWHTIADPPGADFDARLRRLRVAGVREELANLGRPAEEARLYAAYDAHTAWLATCWRSRVDPSPAAQVDAFLDLADLDGGPELRTVVLRAFGEALRETPPVLFPHVHEVLRRLKSYGYAIGLVSNTGRTWGRVLRPIQDDLGIGALFDVRIFSDEVGVRKPDPRIFEAALEGIRLRPEETVHIGDDIGADVEGAKAVGMHAVWFHPTRGSVVMATRADAEVADHADLPSVLARWFP